MFNKMLVVIDGLDMSEKVFDVVVYLVKEQQVELSIFYVGREVVVMIFFLMGIVYVFEYFIDEIRNEVKKEGLKIFENVREKVVENGV